MDKNELEEVKNWRLSSGLSFITSPENDAIEQAVKLSGAGFGSLAPREQDEILSVLSSWHFFLSAEMGRIYARVVAAGSATDRAKLNMIKPAAEALKVKVDTLKKIYDRRIRELTNPKRTEAD